MSPALKYWDGSVWQTLAGAPGPAGPMRELGVVTFGSITAAAAPGTLFADFGTIAFDGQPITVEFVVGFINLNTDSNCSVHLHDFITGSDVLVTRMAFWRNAVTVRDGSGVWCPVTCAVRITPSAGNHRYRLRFQLDSGVAGIMNPLEQSNYARIVKAVGPGLAGSPLYLTPAQFATLIPIDGMEVYLQVDAANGVVWHLRYNAASASANKWEYLGGPPLRGFYATAENVPAAWASGNPAITVPRVGDYDVEWQGDINISGLSQFYMAFYLDAVRNDAIVAAVFGTANPQEVTYAAQNRVAITTGQIVRPGFVQTGAQGTAKNRTLIVRPVRVG